MIKNNPDDSVLEEQSGAIEDAAGTEKTTQAEKANEFETLDDIVLPPVDYSGYSKNELVETLALIIENRPPAEIRSDVDRIKILFYQGPDFLSF